MTPEPGRFDGSRHVCGLRICHEDADAAGRPARLPRTVCSALTRTGSDFISVQQQRA